MGAPVTLAELAIAAASEAWRGDGEVLASGIGVVPRLAASLAKLTHSPELMMTDAEAHLVEEPVPLGPRGTYQPKFSGSMSFARVFDCVWGGRRHVMIGPIQIDRYGQTNLSGIGDRVRPKVQMLGMRGLPGNSMCHANSMFVTAHSKRVFVPGEVDIVGGVGYNPARWPAGANSSHVDLRLIVSDLCVMDFGGTGHAIRVRSLHPGVTLDAVRQASGFPLEAAGQPPATAMPTEEQLAIIHRLDPHDLRAGVFKGNPLVGAGTAA
ncbi:MAG: ketoacid CoA transferase [Proteobacteria bacterium]|nr:ketoacid CoA transferase [Pseudomonadota bacterium]